MVTPSVTGPGDTNPSDATGVFRRQGELTSHSSIQYCARDVYGSSDGHVARSDAQMDHSRALRAVTNVTYFGVTESPTATSRPTQTVIEQLRKIGVHTALVCTQHGDELRIVNNGNDGDDDDDDSNDNVGYIMCIRHNSRMSSTSEWIVTRH